jgi:hypothetical protein
MPLHVTKYDEMVSRMKKEIHRMYAIEKYEWDDMFVVFDNTTTSRQRVHLAGSFEIILKEYVPQTDAFNTSFEIFEILKIVASGFLSLHSTIEITPLMLSAVLEKSFDMYMYGTFCDTLDIVYEDESDQSNDSDPENHNV